MDIVKKGQGKTPTNYQVMLRKLMPVMTTVLVVGLMVVAAGAARADTAATVPEITGFGTPDFTGLGTGVANLLGGVVKAIVPAALALFVVWRGWKLIPKAFNAIMGG